MADHADDGDDVFVYMGGRAPQHVTHVRVHKSVKIITANAWESAFEHCRELVSIEMHNGVEIIEYGAFYGCISLRSIKLPGVRVIEKKAFWNCTSLEDVEFGDKLETIGELVFQHTSLRKIKIPKVSNIGNYAFFGCKQLNEVELSEDLETIERSAFENCPRLRSIAMPLKGNLLGDDVFSDCTNLSHVDIVGGIHKTISSLLLQSWRNEMNDEIDRINRDLPKFVVGKTTIVRRWMATVIERIDHYKSEHYVLLKKSMTLLELALWKNELEKTAKDEDEEEHSLDEKQPAKKAKISEHGETTAASKTLHAKEETNAVDASRQKARVTCGANIIIPHVLSFLNDADVFPLLNQNA